jgi:hypothetical protein
LLPSSALAQILSLLQDAERQNLARPEVPL